MKRKTTVYRPYIADADQTIRRRVDALLRKNDCLNKQGLEKMIFAAGLPVIEQNMKIVTGEAQ
jgi:hypothetical protein